MQSIDTIDRDEVRASLRTRIVDVLAAFGISARRSGRELRTRCCPSCGQRSRDSVCISLRSGEWFCHRCGAHGDVFALVAGYGGIDVRRDFPRVLRLAARIVQLAPVAPLWREVVPHDNARSAREAFEPLPPWHARGVEYLRRERGFGDGTDLLLREGRVRFNAVGDVCVALYSLDACIVNVVRRRLSAEEPKVLGLRGCTTSGSLVGPLPDDAAAARVVLVEGVMDTLAAVIAFPGWTVVGAHGASRIAQLAEAVVPRIVAARGILALVPHVDCGTGERAMASAASIARREGLVLDESLLLIDVQPASDLAEALQNGTFTCP